MYPCPKPFAEHLETMDTVFSVAPDQLDTLLGFLRMLIFALQRVADFYYENQ